MAEQNKNPKYYFDIHASVVIQLGDRLISDVAQALVELVKNSYDADATHAKVIVNTEEQPGEGFYYPNASGYISIEDNGIGMNEATIIRGWLTVSDSPKREMKKKGLTTERGRTPLGDKGLGRLCAQRLANNVEIFTRPKGSAVEYHIGFSWSSFLEDGITLTQVPIFVEEIEPQRECGTRLIISDLKDKGSWIKGGTADDLQKKLSQLISPYEEVRDFILSAIINGRRLELAEYNGDVKKFAIVNYKFIFDGNILYVNSKATLNLFKPAYTSSTENKLEYRKHVEGDNGENFWDFLVNLGQADRFYLKKSEEENWFIEYSYTRKFVEIDKLQSINKILANPGSFHGELDVFKFDNSSELKTSLGGDSIPRAFIKDIGGLRIYRDGFGIRTDNDLLELGKQQTSGRSWYGHRPENITGYIALSAKENAVLQEKTDREGFQEDQYYRNFYILLQEISKFTSETQNFLRRSYNNFIRVEEEKTLMKATNIEEVSQEINVGLASATIYEESLRTMQTSLGDVVKEAQTIQDIAQYILPDNLEQKQTIEIATQSITQRIEHARKEVNQAETYLHTLPEIKQKVDLLNDQLTLLKNQIALLGEQLSQTYETVGLGLSAETLSHEFTNITDQLTQRNRQVIDYMIKYNVSDMMFKEFTRYINTAVASLRKQLSHLGPSLRYVREHKETIVLAEYFEEVQEYYASRFAAYKIQMQIKDTRNTEEFVLWMNRGKLNQIIDNLLLNSEYWLREDLRIQRIKSGIITIELSKPFVRVSDNGRGIEPTVEKSLFEPFVTTKGQGRGRGLGLFIIQQLLGSENCRASLSPVRNADGKLYVFEIDLAGGLYSGK